MNKQVFLLIIAMFCAHASMVYTVDVDRAGFASITLSMEGGGSAEVALPRDAGNFRIVGGSYSIANSSASVVPGKLGFTTFSFSSNMLTEKTGASWKLYAYPPEGAETAIYMPAYTTIEEFSSQPEKVSAEDSRTLVEMGDSGPVQISYMLDEQPVSEAGEDLFFFYLIAGIAALLLAREAMLRFPANVPKALPIERGVEAQGKKAGPGATLEMTPGKEEMMETFNRNDLKVVNFLLENGGKSRRNLLERKAGISKSSLSMAIRRLERRKIIEIDRTSTTHFVKLSEKFLTL